LLYLSRCPASVIYRGDKSAMAKTGHPTITGEVTAPAVILAFSFGV
jgi:hypothetical protein